MFLFILLCFCFFYSGRLFGCRTIAGDGDDVRNPESGIQTLGAPREHGPNDETKRKKERNARAVRRPTWKRKHASTGKDEKGERDATVEERGFPSRRQTESAVPPIFLDKYFASSSGRPWDTPVHATFPLPPAFSLLPPHLPGCVGAPNVCFDWTDSRRFLIRLAQNRPSFPLLFFWGGYVSYFSRGKLRREQKTRTAGFPAESAVNIQFGAS